MQTTLRPAREDRPWLKDFRMGVMKLFLRDSASRDRFIWRNLEFVGVPAFRHFPDLWVSQYFS